MDIPTLMAYSFQLLKSHIYSVFITLEPLRHGVIFDYEPRALGSPSIKVQGFAKAAYVIGLLYLVLNERKQEEKPKKVEKDI